MVTMTLRVDMDILVEEREGYWAATIGQLGLTVYGPGEQEVLDRAGQAFNFLLENFAPPGEPGSLSKIRRFLDNQGIKHTLEPQGGWRPRRQTFHRRLDHEVPVGVA